MESMKVLKTYFYGRRLGKIIVIRVTYKTGFGLDDCIYWTLYIHTTRNYRQLERDHWSKHFTVDRYTRNRFLSLQWSCPGNGFITVSLSPLSCQYSAAANSEVSTRLFSAPKLISWQAGVSKLDSTLLLSASEFFLITILHRPRRKHRLLFSRIVLGVFTDPLSSNRRPIVACFGSSGNVYRVVA
jgi:hypothetical protein